MANQVLDFLLRTKKQGDAIAEVTEESKKLADTLKNKLALAASEAQVASIRLAQAEEKLKAASDPAEQAKLTNEINKARVAMDNAQAKADKYENELRNVGLAAKDMDEGHRTAGLSITDFKSALDLAGQGLEILNQGYDATIAKAAQWGDDMGDLAQVTGQGVEATSEMAATLELMGIKGDKMGAIIKAMTKEGLQLNLETLLALSKEYQAIQDPIEQNEFLFKKFGKVGIDMAEVLGKDTAEMKAFGDAARYSGKIIGEDTAEAAERLNVQTAILQQRWEGFTIWLGGKAVPVINDAIVGFDNLTKLGGALSLQFAVATGQITQQEAALRAAELAAGDLGAGYLRDWEALEKTKNTTSEYTQALKDADLSIQRVTDSTNANNDATDNSGKVYGEALSALRDFNIGEAQRLALEQAIKLASGELTQEDVARAEAIGFLTKQLELGNITQAQYIEKLNAMATGAATARDAILSIPASSNFDLNFNIRTNGTIPNPAAGDYNLPGGDSGTYNPTPGQDITPVEGAYAQGGSFIVPGVGQGDRPYLVNMTPGERVDITPRGGQSPVTVNVMPGAIVVNGATAPGATADEILQRLGALVRSATNSGAAFVGVTR